MLKWFQNLKLGTKLNLILVLSFGFLLLTVLMVINESIVNFVQQTSQQRVRQEVRLLLNRFQEAESDILKAAHILGTTPALIDDVTNDNVLGSRITAQLAAAQFTLDDVSVINAAHEELLSTLYPTRFEDTDVYLQGRGKLFSYGLVGINTTDVLPVTTKSGNELLLAGSAPIQDRSRTIIGSVVVSRRLNERFLGEINFFRKDIHIALIYQDDILNLTSAHPTMDDDGSETQLLGGRSTLNRASLEQALNGQTIISDQLSFDPENHIPYQMAYTPVEIGGEVISVAVIQLEVGELLYFQQQLIITSTAIIGLLGLMVVVISAIFARRGIINPLKRLKIVSDKMAQGDYSERAPVKSSDEIGQLSQTFNHMVQAIQKRESELRVAMEKAREVAQVKSEFLSTMSHELRTPLNSIIGYSDALLMGVSGELNAAQVNDVNCMRDNGVRLLTLINNVLDLTRIEAKRAEVVYAPFSPRSFAERISAQMRILAQQKNLDFITVIDSTVPQTLIGSEQHLEQIAVNLLSNAIKFTEQGSIKFQIGLSAEHWTLTVCDTGIGIPKKAQEVIFEEFRQLDSSSTRMYKGSGLGLAITRNLVRIMNGQIHLTSAPNQGSTFRVELPLIEVDSTKLSNIQSEVKQ